MIYLFLADGFEETEALVTLDILLRSGAKIKTVGLSSQTITGSHNIRVIADYVDNEIDIEKAEMIILPGGMPGTSNLAQSDIVKEVLEFCDENNKYICAICAAPSILGKYQIIHGRSFTCYPGYENECDGLYKCNSVVIDKNLITANGPGSTFEFAFAIVNTLYGKDMVSKLKRSMQC